VNLTKQDADQEQDGGKGCGCHGSEAVQAIGQEAKNEQGAFAGSIALQFGGKKKCGCHSGGNSSSPVRVGSKGDDEGKTKQANDVSSRGTALNLNATKQKADQNQGGRGGHDKGKKGRGHCGAPSSHDARSSGFSSWYPATRKVPYC
jgi:hypothetical protein